MENRNIKAHSYLISNFHFPLLISIFQFQKVYPKVTLLYFISALVVSIFNFSYSQPKETYTIMGVGDIMLGTNYPNTSYLPPDSGKGLLNPAISLLSSADVTFGNLEGCILDKGGSVKQCKDPSVCYAFRQPPYLADRLVEAGFDILSLANNHLGDFAQEGRIMTQSTLKKKSIHYAGLESCPWDTFTVKGVRYGFSAFAPNNGTLQINDYAMLKSVVSKLDSISDIVIISFHGGAEGATHEHILRTHEIFYGEDRGNVYEFAHLAVDFGADIIFGQGPHVVRAIEVYKNKLIAYSLGNFCTYSRMNLKGVAGFAPLLEVRVDKKGNFISGKIHSFLQQGEGGPILDEKLSAFHKIRDLTQTDFPDNSIKFSENGEFK